MALLAECGIMPIEIEAMIAMAQFLQQVRQLGPDRLPALALQLSIQDSQMGWVSWVAQLQTWLMR